MNVRSIPVTSRRQQEPMPKPKRGYKYKLRLFFELIMAIVLIWATLFFSAMYRVNRANQSNEIRSAILGYCLSAINPIKPNSIVNANLCNGTANENWQFVNNKIELNSKYCLGLNGHQVILNKCRDLASQNWSRKGVGFMDLANNNCLSIDGKKPYNQLITANCANLINVNESWTPTQWLGKPLSATSSPVCHSLALGKRIACYANRQWLAWQTEPNLHPALLTDYTDGNSYEEWCADFVSYIYKEAGVPFSNGERGQGGWDEYNANNIQYMGLTYHSANSGYVAQAGDVAFFNYPGGHVEIVVSGGKHPTFVYGDSGTIPPNTGNGDMAKNQIVNDGSSGHLVYYLSPN